MGFITSFYNKLFTLIIFTGLSVNVNAHASLEEDSATGGESYKAVLRITHGCSGSPTVSVRVRIPDGVKRAKPMSKPGWELDAVVEELDEPYESRDVVVTEDVREINWHDGSLSDDFFDEFVFRMELPEVSTETTIYFRTVQECENGEFHRWVDIPNPDENIDELDAPAPSLTLHPPEV